MPLLSIAMSEVPSTEAGLASGIVNVSMQMAAALGLAVLDTLATDHTHALLASGTAPATALTDGFHLAFTVAAVIVAVGIVIALTVLRGESGRLSGDRESRRQRCGSRRAKGLGPTRRS